MIRMSFIIILHNLTFHTNCSCQKLFLQIHVQHQLCTHPPKKKEKRKDFSHEMNSERKDLVNNVKMNPDYT